MRERLGAMNATTRTFNFETIAIMWGPCSLYEAGDQNARFQGTENILPHLTLQIHTTN